MDEFPKRKINELLFLYRMEPGLGRDIYVEGPGDKWIIDYYLGERSLKGRVYTVDSVDFSGVDFGSLGLPHPSSRSAVIALRKELEAGGVDVSSMMFIVDRDQEDVVASPHISGVRLTDAGALPVHMYDNEVEVKLSIVVLRGRMNRDVLKASVTRCCALLYAVRAASRRSGISAKILPPTLEVLGDESKGFHVCKDSYVRRVLVPCGNDLKFDEFMCEVDDILRLMSTLKKSAFVFINDHDLFSVIKIMMSRLGLATVSPDHVEKMISMSVDAARLSTHSLFLDVERVVSA